MLTIIGSDDGTVRLWEVQTGRCMKTLRFQTTVDESSSTTKSSAVIRCVAWSPNDALSLLAVAVDTSVVIVNTGLGDKVIISNTDDMLAKADEKSSDAAEEEDGKKAPATWTTFDSNKADAAQGFRVKITHAKPVSQVTWHGRGDYFAVTLKDGANMSVLIHQLSKRRSQNPFSKAKGIVQCVMFHPTRPFFFVAVSLIILP